MLNWVQTGYSHIMSKSLEQVCLSKNGGKQYYLQFHIKPWMKHLPWFRRYLDQHPKRKNVKESLRTPSLYEALQLLHTRLAEMGLIWSDQNKRLEPIPAPEDPMTSPEGEYYQALKQLASLDDSQLIPQIDPLHPDAPLLPRDIEEEVFMDAMKSGPTRQDQYSQIELQARHAARMKAYDRAEAKEDSKRFPPPHAYSTTLISGAELLIKDYQDRKKDKKDTAKIKTAVTKFLDWLGEADVSLEKITPQMVKAYFVYSQDLEIPKNTISAEVGKLNQLYNVAIEEGRIPQNTVSPFLSVKLSKYNFKDAETRGWYTTEHVSLLAEEAQHGRPELLINVAVSYYTGMRCSEVYQCKVKQVEDILYFEINAGKTSNSKRNVPIHSHLKSWLEKTGRMPAVGNGFEWQSPNKKSFNQAYQRFNEKHFIQKHGIDQSDGKLTHHSFRHGMSTRLFKAHYSELEVAFVVGHSRKTVAKTESGRTYIHPPHLRELQVMIEKVQPIQLPK